MKLKSRLRKTPLETLQAIAEFWEAQPEDRETLSQTGALIEHLYPRLQTPSHFRQTFDRLEGREREAIYFLALHGGEMPVDEFRKRAALEDEAQWTSMRDRLTRRGFAWAETLRDAPYSYRIIGVPEPYLRMIELPPYWKGFLGFFLQGLDVNRLKAIARHTLGEKYEGRRKQVLVHFVRERLLDPERLRQALESERVLDRDLFDEILKRNGTCVWRDLLDGGTQKRFNNRRAEELQRLIRSSGLVFVSRKGPNYYHNLIMTPRDIRHVIQSGFKRDERSLTELSRGGDRARGDLDASSYRPNVVLDNTQNILRDLTIFLSYILHHQVKPLNNGGIGRNDLKKILPMMSHNKTIKYVSFLALFAMTKKLIIPVGSRWQVSKNAEQWLNDSRRCFREFYEFWLSTNEWNEEYLDGDVVHVDQYPQNLINVIELRKMILRVLEKIPPETWIDFETFAESLLPQVALEIPGRFDHAPGEKFNRHTLLIMESIVADPLYWFGVVTLGVSDLAVARELGNRSNESVALLTNTSQLSPSMYGNEQYAFSFKVSATGRSIFSGGYLDTGKMFASYDEAGLPYYADTQHCTVQPNLEIVTPPDLNLGLFYRLLMFAEVKKVDVMTTLTITRESLRRGMECGLSVENILQFLQEASRRELPETVVHLIEECGSRHGEIDIGLAGGYIVARDRMHTEELRNHARLGRVIKDVIDNKVMLLNRTVDVNKVADELQKMGFMPHVASDTVHVTGEGMFHVTLRPEELYRLLAALNFLQWLEENFESRVFADEIRGLLERLTQDARGEFNPDYYAAPLLKSFQKKYEQQIVRKKDEEKRQLKKQVNRLLTRVPRRREPIRFTGENPTSDPAGIVKLMRFAIEHEMQVKIHYVRSTGEEIDEVIEPESLQGERIYAFCPDHDEHHIYAVKRVRQAAF